MTWQGQEGDFALVRRSEWQIIGFLELGMAQTRHFFSLLLHAILKIVPHTAGHCCCNKQQHKTPRAQQYTSLLMPCARGKLNVNRHRTTPKPETQHNTRQVVESNAALAGKRKSSTKKTCPSGTTTTTRYTTAKTAGFVVIIHCDTCREHSLIERRNGLQPPLALKICR